MRMPNWLKIAGDEKDKNIHEVRGGENPRILEYLRATDIGAPYNREHETAWCSAFANWCMQQVGFKGTRSAAALSWADWGKDVTDEPPMGAIVVFDHGNGSGHVGFFIRGNDNGLFVLGGNQSDAVNVKFFGWSEVVTMRWPAHTPVIMVDTEVE